MVRIHSLIGLLAALLFGLSSLLSQQAQAALAFDQQQTNLQERPSERSAKERAPKKERREERPGREAKEPELYLQAQTFLRSGAYRDAVTVLLQLLRQNPYGRYAEQAQLDLIFAYYASSDPEAALRTCEQFLRLNSRHPNVDYVVFMRALASYTREREFITRIFNLDLGSRARDDIQKSYDLFDEFQRIYPESKYSALARRRMVSLRNLLARNEVLVSEFYLERQLFVPALQRAHWVINNFSNTEYVAWGLALASKAYERMGVLDLGELYLQTLKKNFPGHESLKSDGTLPNRLHLPTEEATLIEVLTLGVFAPPSSTRNLKEFAASDNL